MVEFDDDDQPRLKPPPREPRRPHGSDIRDLIAEGVELAFERMGIDVQDRAAMRADFAHLRRGRLFIESAWSWALKSAIGVALTAVCSALWFALKTDFHQR